MDGSDDLFPDKLYQTYRPHQSINFVTAHDGFCLYDLVAYDHKHNDANGHDNTDGSNDNLSWNCGAEGDAFGVPGAVLALRRQQAKNFCALMMLANGIPMIVAGDEFLNTQQGNNNPYNQDNEITWLDWSRLDANRDIFRFFKLMIAFRKAHGIGRATFWRDDVSWAGTDGPVDLSRHSRCVAYALRGAAARDGDLYVMINGHWGEDHALHASGRQRRRVAAGRRHGAPLPRRHRPSRTRTRRWTAGTLHSARAFGCRAAPRQRNR